MPKTSKSSPSTSSRRTKSARGKVERGEISTEKSRRVARGSTTTVRSKVSPDSSCVANQSRTKENNEDNSAMPITQAVAVSSRLFPRRVELLARACYHLSAFFWFRCCNFVFRIRYGISAKVSYAGFRLADIILETSFFIRWLKTVAILAVKFIRLRHDPAARRMLVEKEPPVAFHRFARVAAARLGSFAEARMLRVPGLVFRAYNSHRKGTKALARFYRCLCRCIWEE